MTGSEKTYNWDARQYARHSGSQYAWGLELIDKLALQGHESVLDVGCGDGKVTAIIADQVPSGEVVGIDSSPEMIALAAECWSHFADARLRFVHQDVRELNETDRFDVIFSNAALHWVQDHPPMLARIARALKPGGRLLFQMGGRGNAARVAATLNSVIAKHWGAWFLDFTFPYGFHGPEEYAGWLTGVGLTPQRVELVEKDMRHETCQDFTGWIQTTWLPYLERVPDQRRQAFVDDIVGQYLRSHPPDADGCVHVDMVRLEVAALKSPPVSCPASAWKVTAGMADC